MKESTLHTNDSSVQRGAKKPKCNILLLQWLILLLWQLSCNLFVCVMSQTGKRLDQTRLSNTSQMEWPYQQATGESTGWGRSFWRSRWGGFNQQIHGGPFWSEALEVSVSVLPLRSTHVCSTYILPGYVRSNPILQSRTAEPGHGFQPLVWIRSMRLV